MSPDLRQRLIDVADHAPQPGSMPPELVRGVRTRQIRTIAVGSVIVAVVAAGAFGGLRAAGERITVYGPSGAEDVDPDGVLALRQPRDAARCASRPSRGLRSSSE